MMAKNFRTEIGKISAISRDLSFLHSKKFLLNFPQTKALLLGNMLKLRVNQLCSGIQWFVLILSPSDFQQRF